jgi:quercetin dioxygenase-like cupin family protein
MKVKILSGICILLFFVNINAQNRQYAVPGDIASYIDRFELRTSDINKNGWSHYYIPRGMGDTLTVKMSCVYSGMQTHAPHVHAEDEAFYIIKGPVNFHINGEERIFATGDFIYTPSGSSHNIQRVNERDTIKYLVLKREALKSVDKPHPVSKPDYTFDDCSYRTANHPEWTNAATDVQSVLLDKRFADGFHVVLERVTKNGKTFQSEKSGRTGQTAFYIISGEATVTLDGQKSHIEADNTFYCPRNTAWSLTQSGDNPLLFLTVTTE